LTPSRTISEPTMFRSSLPSAPFSGYNPDSPAKVNISIENSHRHNTAKEYNKQEHLNMNSGSVVVPLLSDRRILSLIKRLANASLPPQPPAAAPPSGNALSVLHLLTLNEADEPDEPVRLIFEPDNRAPIHLVTQRDAPPAQAAFGDVMRASDTEFCEAAEQGHTHVRGTATYANGMLTAFVPE
jgi:hypothetical protein